MALLHMYNQGAVIMGIQFSAPITHFCSGVCWHDLDYHINCVPSERGVCGLLTSKRTRLIMGHREGAKCSELSRTPWNLLSNPPPTGHQDFGPTSESESGAAGNVGKGVVAWCWDLREDEGGQWIKEVGRCWWSCVAENLMVSQRTSRSERGRDLLEWHGEWGVEQALEANILSSCLRLFFPPFPWIPSLGTFLISYSLPL